MASFDFVECSSKSYRFVWAKRVDVFRLSAMVLTLKILSFVSFVVFDVQQEVLRQGLYLLPSTLLEGWVIAHLMIMALHYDDAEMGRKSKFLPSPGDVEKNIKASMIVYVLMKLMLSFVTGTTFEGARMAQDGPPPEPGLQGFFVAVMLIAFMIWAFRFLWLYVPMVLGCGPLEFLERFKAFVSSFSFLGVWVMCFVPLILAMLVVSEAFGMVAGVFGVGVETVFFESGLAAIQAVTDYLMSLIASIGIAYGVCSVFRGDNKLPPIW